MNGYSRYLAFIIVGTLLLWGASSNTPAAAGPEITKSFASKEIHFGGTWKVYFNASDPGGKMRYIYAMVEQPGSRGYPLSMIRIKDENRKELSGYIYFNTNSSDKPMDFISLNLVVQIGDGNGNFSERAVFPLTFRPRAAQETPPPGVFKDNALGPIMIKLYPGADDGGGSSYGR
jgi:hypothetical protein